MRNTKHSIRHECEAVHKFKSTSNSSHLFIGECSNSCFSIQKEGRREVGVEWQLVLGGELGKGRE